MRLAENALTKEIWPRPSVTRMLGNLISNCLLQRQFRDGGMVALLAGGVEKTQGGRYTSLLGATIPWRMTARLGGRRKPRNPPRVLGTPWWSASRQLYLRRGHFCLEEVL